MDTDRWEIIDDKGVVYSGGSEEEMRSIFGAIVDGNESWIPENGWKGDLKLIQVHAIHR